MKNNFSISDAKFICAAKEVREPKKMANILDMSQASINVCVQRIEKKLGKKIFFRKQNPSTFDLTEDGLELYPYCKRMVESSDALQESLEAQDSPLQGEVKIVGPQNILEHFIVPYFASFTLKNPRISPSLNQMDDMFYEGLSINEFYFTSEVKNDADLWNYIPYHNFTQKLWASEIYLKKHGAIETMDDLYRHSLLFQKGFFHNTKIMGMPPAVRASIAYNEIRTFDVAGSRTVDLLCQAGAGIMNGSMETTKLAGLNVRQILPEITGETVKIYIKANKRFLTKKVGQFCIDWLLNARDKTLERIGVTPSFDYKSPYSWGKTKPLAEELT
jgi:DNA-binding transcriptional LysR family regulator